MGTLSYTTKCGPDGQTVVTLNATTGNLDVTIDGQLAVVDSDGDGNHDIVTGPGEHTAVWWKPGTTERIPENVWGSKTITVPALTDCVVPTTTTAAPTTSEAPTESTALVPPSTIATTITPQIDMDVDPCVTSATTCTTAAATGRLPETGDDNTAELLGGASVLLAAGVALVLIKRNWRVTS
jgi:LPXTG-motif cell wall-anchored protein